VSLAAHIADGRDVSEWYNSRFLDWEAGVQQAEQTMMKLHKVYENRSDTSKHTHAPTKDITSLRWQRKTLHKSVLL
jgi:hypothetical protein